MERFVIIDVETTGVSFAKGDRVIQLAYVVVENMEITDRYSSYVNPERSIPPFIQSLTGINKNHTEKAPLFKEAVIPLLEALDGAFFVAHNAEFDLNFINEELTAAGYSPYAGPVIDTVELSKIAYPSADSFRLSRLSEYFSVNHDQPHRADSDAEATAQLFIQIVEKISALPFGVLRQLNKLSGSFKSHTASLIHKWQLAKMSEKAAEHLEEYRELVIRKAVKKKNEQSDGEQPDFSRYFSDYLTNEAWCKERMPNYEIRPGQLRMMEFVHERLTEKTFGLIEAGTGTGKTLAYLVPAAFKAKHAGEPVVISTQTIQLQEQLVKKEIPALKNVLPFSVKYALLKGRGHYICLHKFEQLLQNDLSGSYERSLLKAQILVWLTETETGDVEELSLAPRSSRFWQEIASDAISCTGPDCPWFSRCFYQRAKRLAKEADLIITNHSLVLADSKAEHQIIPGFKHIIFDEAHHLEDTATEQFGLQLDYLSLTHLLNEMGTEDGEGWLASLSALSSSSTKNFVSRLNEQGINLKQEWYELFLLLNQYVQGKNTKYNERGRYTKKIDHGDQQWSPVTEAALRCRSALREVYLSLDTLQDILEENENDNKFIPGFNETLRNFFERTGKVLAMFESLLLDHDESMIYWMEAEIKGPKQSVYVHGRPVEVADLLADGLFSKKESIIFTSATLAVGKKFNYITQRLGLEDFPTESEIVESPFNWGEQVQLMIPTDMPLIQEAGENNYIEAAVVQLYRIAQITKGKMLVLFTSYDMLKKCYYHLKDMLDDEFILVAQGVQSGSRSKLTKNFQQFEQSILLGTSSFWEGVDIPGKDLSVTVIVRLPFSPPDDPVFQAKSSRLKEEGINPFMKLALPQAILRFKQGFGRLIRTSSDKGAVMVLDRRIVTTRYGGSFIKSLPDIPVLEKPLDELEEELSDWLK
ncbi:ATP-dependent DNA helicase DinG [Evansella clarkii]|uniref:ATP-dependent DNA helicase DinG n=1 Tax=Evansella clarkii TaxID=79879 RepID=UPI000B43DC3D|nr:ATP-dependent DNA helicase DinG [Evansella clarkii]